eukprot:CAMPEP_0183801878 /NCGR_PEP_ID=MMETSP0803_2-20130417/28963_1 /TAXON_ID=195967 /ORGANISM="Crustomastix stigmata, Strain CCMP3273" /LENGTH=927 /DNA_ID=CAMNT_0026046609 /DNA_START=900 /DNA_END=3683 /DNA_ORIENTATION=-
MKDVLLCTAQGIYLRGGIGGVIPFHVQGKATTASWIHDKCLVIASDNGTLSKLFVDVSESTVTLIQHESVELCGLPSGGQFRIPTVLCNVSGVLFVGCRHGASCIISQPEKLDFCQSVQCPPLSKFAQFFDMQCVGWPYAPAGQEVIALSGLCPNAHMVRVKIATRMHILAQGPLLSGSPSLLAHTTSKYTQVEMLASHSAHLTTDAYDFGETRMRRSRKRGLLRSCPTLAACYFKCTGGECGSLQICTTEIRVMGSSQRIRFKPQQATHAACMPCTLGAIAVIACGRRLICIDVSSFQEMSIINNCAKKSCISAVSFSSATPQDKSSVKSFVIGMWHTKSVEILAWPTFSNLSRLDGLPAPARSIVTSCDRGGHFRLVIGTLDGWLIWCNVFLLTGNQVCLEEPRAIKLGVKEVKIYSLFAPRHNSHLFVQSCRAVVLYEFDLTLRKGPQAWFVDNYENISSIISYGESETHPRVLCTQTNGVSFFAELQLFEESLCKSVVLKGNPVGAVFLPQSECAVVIERTTLESSWLRIYRVGSLVCVAEVLLPCAFQSSSVSSCRDSSCSDVLLLIGTFSASRMASSISSIRELHGAVVTVKLVTLTDTRGQLKTFHLIMCGSSCTPRIYNSLNNLASTLDVNAGSLVASHKSNFHNMQLASSTMNELTQRLCDMRQFEVPPLLGRANDNTTKSYTHMFHLSQADNEIVISRSTTQFPGLVKCGQTTCLRLCPLSNTLLTMANPLTEVNSHLRDDTTIMAGNSASRKLAKIIYLPSKTATVKISQHPTQLEAKTPKSEENITSTSRTTHLTARTCCDLGLNSHAEVCADKERGNRTQLCPRNTHLELQLLGYECTGNSCLVNGMCNGIPGVLVRKATIEPLSKTHSSLCLLANSHNQDLCTLLYEEGNFLPTGLRSTQKLEMQIDSSEHIF